MNYPRPTFSVTTVLISVIAFSAALRSSAQIPQIINYQGRVSVIGTNFDGAGQFKFALVNGAGSTSYWSHNGSSAGGGQPSTFVTLTVTKGLYSVLLGDTTIANMTVAIPPSVFTNSDVRLRVWFNAGAGFVQLSPDQRIAAVGYAFMAANLPDGLITSNKLAANAINSSILADGSVTSPKIADGAIAPGDLSVAVASNTFWRLGGNIEANPASGAFLGTTDSNPLELKVNGQRAFRLEPQTLSGAIVPNVIAGSAGNYAVPGTVGATIGGGGSTDPLDPDSTNVVSGNFSTIAGGLRNKILGAPLEATISGGWQNTIQAGNGQSTIAGGYANTIQDGSFYSTIGGGSANFVQTNADASAIGGGNGNRIQSGASESAIGGGSGNRIWDGAYDSTISGGDENSIRESASESVISGGYGNTIYPNAYWSSIAGGASNTIGSNALYSALGGGAYNRIGTRSVAAVIAGGSYNDIGTNAGSSTIGGGSENIIRALSYQSTVGGGFQNVIETNADGSTIAGGTFNQIAGNAERSTIAGGDSGTIEAGAFWSTIGGGINNHVSAAGAVVSGGGYASYPGHSDAGGNTASGSGSMIPGGLGNVAGGRLSFAAGDHANALHDGTFVWADSPGDIVPSKFISTAPNQFLVRASGGMGIGATNLAGALTLRAPMGVPVCCMNPADNPLALGLYSTNGYKWIQSYGGDLVINQWGNNVGIGKTNPATPLDVNGTVSATALRAPGAGTNTSTFAFTQRAVATNTINNYTTIYNSISDGDPGAILIVTHNWTADTNSTTKYSTEPVGVFYSSGHWAIFNESQNVMALGRAFNVMVIKP